MSLVWPWLVTPLGKDLLCFCFQGCGLFIAWSHVLTTCNETGDFTWKLPALFTASPGVHPQYCINYHVCVIPALWRWRQDILSYIENCACQSQIHDSVSKIRHLTYYRKQGKNGHTCQKNIDPLSLVPLRMFIYQVTRSVSNRSILRYCWQMWIWIYNKNKSEIS